MLEAMNATLEAPPTEERRRMTPEEFDGLPDAADVDRWIIDGRLYEQPMTSRSHPHGGTEVNIAFHLKLWMRQQSTPPGRVFGGEAGFYLRREPLTKVGIDVAYVTNDQTAATSPNAAYIEGAPLLAVEIMSPSDDFESTTDKINAYLQAGVASDAAPRAFGVGDELTAEPHLPGFRVAVAEVFAR